MRDLRWWVVLAMEIVMAGCQQRAPEGILVRGMRVNGYDFDYVLESPSSIQADARDLRISTGKTLIEVTDGTLRVDGRSYGAVKPADRISVEGHKVSVNGDLRKEAD